MDGIPSEFAYEREENTAQPRVASRLGVRMHSLAVIPTECCKPKVMVVDDDALSLIGLKSLIKSNFEDVKVIEAENGEVALQRYIE